MNRKKIQNYLRTRRGIAMTETALLCFFLYVPVLMMVIIWGDMTLDKTRAHVAGAYLAFRGSPADEAEMREIFFPGASGFEDGTRTVRRAEIEFIGASRGPRFTLPDSPAGDYRRDAPPEHDLQFRLYSMALGRTWITTHVDSSGDGVDFHYQIHRLRSDMARYLSNERIVNVGRLPDNIPPVRPGETWELDTGTESRAYTGYVEALTAIFNDALTGGRMPRGESAAVLRTSFRSPFFRELEMQYDPRTMRGRAAGGGLPRAFEMQFGPPDAPARTSPWRENQEFHTGYAYLRNPDAHPRGDSLLDDIAAVSADAMLQETRDLFRQTVDEVDVHPGAMGRLRAHSTERGPDHRRFLEPGDPRPRE